MLLPVRRILAAVTAEMKGGRMLSSTRKPPVQSAPALPAKSQEL